MRHIHSSDIITGSHIKPISTKIDMLCYETESSSDSSSEVAHKGHEFLYALNRLHLDHVQARKALLVLDFF